MKKRLVWIVILILIILAFITAPTYLKKAIIYNFVGIDDYKLFENRPIKPGKHHTWAISNRYNKAEIPKSLNDTLEHYNTIAYLLIQNDSIIHESYWDSYDKNSITNSFSMAKSIIGLLCGAAIDDGFFSLDQSVKDFIPELKNATNTPLTIRHLLNMSSGSNWEETYASPLSQTTKAYYGTNLKGLISDIQILEKPGIKFSYQSGNTQMLALILERATSKSISDYTSEKLWTKIGAKNTALWSLDKENGTEKAYCCFNSNARDFARLGALVLNNGKYLDSTIISQPYINEMIQPATWLKDKNNMPVSHYGLHWWIIDYKGQQIPYARGILGQYIFVLKKQNAILVRLGHKRSKAYRNHHPSDIYTYLDLAMSLLN